MISEERRKKIINLLKKADRPLSGTELSEKYNVSRQIIVQDIAILRAEGNDIIATAKGYLFPKIEMNTIHKTIAVKHTNDSMENELYTIVEYGAKVLDVTVEHPIYGELKANLMLTTQEDVDNFIADFKASGAEPLSVMTNGVHLHTIEVPSIKVYDMIINDLKEKGLLLDK
ncbi:transcription repressor NadR [Alkalibacter mobilis]|uniref:transcription repressor NadR n=1 Tax=Alkalibacter mobilis TaxID=2787712 RepID=UPI00189DDE5C|nr:transcription repressor NadR [Alkalibacter mobilis]MBF7097319.1 transcription repressor NadR [Alkalibacter mobilis]